MNIIDIRDKDKYDISHIHNAISIPSNLLLQNPSKYLNKIDTYQIYCTSGVTSKMVVNILNNLGYNTVNLDGGYNKYMLNK